MAQSQLLKVRLMVAVGIFCILVWLVAICSYYNSNESTQGRGHIYRYTQTAYTCLSKDIVCVTYEDKSAHNRHVYYEDFGSDGSVDTVVLTIDGQHGKDQLVRYVIGGSSDLLGKKTEWGPATVAFGSNTAEAAQLQNEYYEARQKYVTGYPEEANDYYENSEYADRGPARSDLAKASSFVKLHEVWAGLNEGHVRNMVASILRDMYLELRNAERRVAFDALQGTYRDNTVKDQGWGEFNAKWFPNSNDPQWSMDQVPEKDRAGLKAYLAELRKNGLAPY